MLNLGCGSRYHPDWTNIDFTGGETVIGHNLLEGIPFENNSFDVVYHSHVLEHFAKKDAEVFLQECKRVLKSKGVLRIAVPDLERIAKEYLRNLELSLAGDDEAPDNYNWIMLEMYDQAVRNKSGGEIAEYLFKEELANEKYVFERLGEEARTLRQHFLMNLDQNTASKAVEPQPKSQKVLRRLIEKAKSRTIRILKKRYAEGPVESEAERIGKFRLSGENHQWMYDRYSLRKLLEQTGFEGIKVKDAFTSSIHDWNRYELEVKNGVIFKPDSLFIEAVKP